MGFHGAVGAGVIFGSEIIGTTYQTNSTPPYIELGPNVTQQQGAPALIMVDGTTTLYPAYVGTVVSGGVSATTISADQGSEGNGASLQLNGDLPSAQPGKATIVAPGGLYLYGVSEIASEVPGFLYVNPGAVTTDASGNFTIAHPWGAAYTTTVGYILVTQPYYITIANRSSTVITFRAYDHTGTAVANSTVNPYGFLMTANG